MAPWNGYWFSAIDSYLRLIFEPPINLPPAATMNQYVRTLNKNINVAVSDSNWYVKLTLQEGKSVDQLGGFGISSNVKAGFNAAYDLPHPPKPPTNNYIYLAFPHPEWNSVIGPDFSTDVKPSTELSNWKFIASSSNNQTSAVLSWDSTSIPKGVMLILTDINNGGTKVNMSTTGSYIFDINGIDSMLITSNITGISQQATLAPKMFELFQNYPNPFNPSTIINYSVPKSSLVTIKVYDVLGREVATLVKENKKAGSYSVQFNAGNGFSSGVYFYRMQAGSFVQTKKLLLIK